MRELIDRDENALYESIRGRGASEMLVSLVRAVKEVRIRHSDRDREVVDDGVEPLMITASDLAQMLQISERQIWRMRDTGRLPSPIELGPKNLRWSRGEILEWIEAACPTRRNWESRKQNSSKRNRTT